MFSQVHVTFLSVLRLHIIVPLVQTFIFLRILLELFLKTGPNSELHPIIYRTFETMSSHPAARVNECRLIDVTPFDPDTTHTCFLIDDAIMLMSRGTRSAVWHTNDRPQAEMCLCVYISVFVCGRWNWLDSPCPLLTWHSGPQLKAPPPITDGLCPSCRRLARTCLPSLSTNRPSLSPDVAPGPPLPASLPLSLSTRDHHARQKEMKLLVQALCSQSETLLGTLRVPSGTLGARPQVARALASCMCYKPPLHFHPSFWRGFLEMREGCWARGGPRGVATSYS